MRAKISQIFCNYLSFFDKIKRRKKYIPTIIEVIPTNLFKSLNNKCKIMPKKINNKEK